MSPAKHVYSSERIPLPNVDLLTLLFDSEHCRATNDTVVHADAADPRKHLTKASCRVLTEQVAYFLRNQYKIGASGPYKDIVVTVSTGNYALPSIFYGTIAAGGVYSAASQTGTASELARQIRDGPGKVVVCSADLKDLAVEAAKIAGVSTRNVLVLSSDPTIKLESVDGQVKCDFKGRLAWRKVTDPKELEKSKACLVYSSGTTGLPKGVLISHTNMVSEIYLPSCISRPYWDEEERQGKPFEQRTLGHLPTAHIAGIQGYFVNPFYAGGTVYWMPRFNFDDFLRYCSDRKITNFFTVPPIYLAIAKHPGVKDQFRFMKAATSGAAPLAGDIQEAATGKMNFNDKISQVWGLSETTGAATFCPPGRPFAMGSLGYMLPNVEMRLVDDNGNDVKAGEPGEALMRGPIVTQGYHNNPEANKNSYTSDGWLKTGDILQARGQEFFVVDRKKELIKYKAHQVAPAELEGLIASHPAVLDAAVIGIAKDGTEVPRAYVVLAPPAVGKVSENDIIEFVKGKVSDYKRLRGGVRFVEAVPRSAAGKILRKDLRELRKREERGSKL